MRSTARKGAGGAALVDVTVVIVLLVVGGGEAPVPLHSWNALLAVGVAAAIVWSQLWLQAPARDSGVGGDDYMRGYRDAMGPLP